MRQLQSNCCKSSKEFVLLFYITLFSTITSMGQGIAPSIPTWSVSGNNISSGKFIGTTNSTSLVLKANNNTGLEINPNGDVLFDKLKSMGDGLIGFGNDGKVGPILFPGPPDREKVLTGDKTWSAISDLSGWKIYGSNVSLFYSGNVGIGTSNPTSKLDVNGNANISGDLYTQTLKVGSISDNVELKALSSGGVMLLGIGTTPRPTPSCTPAYTTGNVQFNRITITNSLNNNAFDFRNDGTNSYIDFGSSLFSPTNPSTTIKINSACASNIDMCSAGGSVYMSTTPTGRVGVGTSTPSEKLDVTGNIAINNNDILLRNHHHGLGWYHNNLKPFNGNTTDPLDGPVLYGFNGGALASTNETPGARIALRWDQNGNIGIGVPSPSERLEVAGNVKVGANQIYLIDHNHGLGYFYDSYATTGAFVNKIIDGPVLYGYGGGALGTNQAGNRNVALFWDANGNVSIGTDYIKDHNGYRLAVEGKILAEEVLIKLRQYWPDYVFNNSYNLRSLEDLEKYIKANQHLPEVPSAKEIETKGLTVGEMSAIQMQKIEEFSLYLIEMKKEIEALKAENEKLKERVK